MENSLFFLQQLGITLLLGGLIGLERERNHEQEGVHDFGGIRTMSLTAVYAFLIYQIFSEDTVMFALFSGGFLALVISSYLVSSFVNKSVGATTELAAMFVFVIGLLMGMGEVLIASVIGLVLVLLLHFKQSLHHFAHSIEREELYDTIKFIAIAFVVLPLLPNEAYGPLEVINPYVIWLVVVFITSISFVSYIAIKLLGPKKGIGMSGFLGGLISSTAVSMSFSQLSKQSKTLVNCFVFGILIASSSMFFRVLLEVSVLNPNLIEILWLPLTTMGGVGLLLSAYFWFKKGKKLPKSIQGKELELKSPFQLLPALQFGLLFAALLFISKYMSSAFGAEGVYLTALLSGFVDVDAITVSMASLSAQGDINEMVASTAITLAAMTNTLVKGGIVFAFASKAVGRKVLFSMLLMIASGVIVLSVFLPSYYGFIRI